MKKLLKILAIAVLTLGLLAAPVLAGGFHPTVKDKYGSPVPQWMVEEGYYCEKEGNLNAVLSYPKSNYLSEYNFYTYSAITSDKTKYLSSIYMPQDQVMIVSNGFFSSDGMGGVMIEFGYNFEREIGYYQVFLAIPFFGMFPLMGMYIYNRCDAEEIAGMILKQMIDIDHAANYRADPRGW